MNTDGIPMMRCILIGNGNIAAPAIETENDNMITAGSVFIPFDLHVRYKPITKKTLRREQRSIPVENTVRELVPNAPNSLTNLDR